nr:Gfo/Idh/MocA family oxidoreductase [Allomuricauda sp.]|tara:strand:- start:27510 stop:28691 length:1182 start_codon:yes stop_codon:yes gene_type:complete
MTQFLRPIGFAIFLAICMGHTEKPSLKTEKSNHSIQESAQNRKEPLKVAVIGLTHTHVHWILGREEQGDIEIVGIVEPNRALAKRYAEQHGYSMDIVFDSMEALYEKVRPEAVTAFNPIYGHLEVVAFFAPKGVHIMVEKPLAVSWQHAQKMASLAREHKVHLLTNYETSWYGSNEKAYELVKNDKIIGPIQRLVFHHGHPGPIEIGCNDEFLEWLTDPILNGGGALTDFGCYGANLATWLLEGQAPEKVTCVTKQYKPQLYPKVEDDATIVLDYADVQVIIQASWNWSHNRKDMEIYGKNGYVICKDAELMEVLENEKEGPKALRAQPIAKGVHDPFAYLYQVVKHGMPVDSFGVSSLENNLIVTQILEAAKHSAKTGKTVIWKDFFTGSTP